MNGIRRFVPVLAGLSLAVSAAMWAVISPVGSSPDDDFHMASIWCAWGPHETCVTERPVDVSPDLPGATYYVPSSIGFQCFVESTPASAECIDEQPLGWIPGRVNAEIGTYPPVFHAAMRVFVGEDETQSVRNMRIANGVLAGVLLAYALTVLRPRFRRAVAITWLVAIIPFGLWFIASTNPSSWAIMAGGLFWAFLANWLSDDSLRSRSAWLSLVGVIATVVLAAGARSDAALALVIAALGVAIFLAPKLRRHPRRLLLLAAPIPFLALGLAYRIRSFGGLQGAIDWGTIGEDGSFAGLAGQWIRYTAEFPALISGMIGGGSPEFLQAPIYIFGLANQDVLMPSLVLVFNLLLVGAALFWGLQTYSWPKILAATFLGLMLLVLPLITLSRYYFTNMYQPRYLLPLFLAFLGIIVTSRIGGAERWRLVQAYGAAVLVALVGSAALLATVRRFTNGQTETWLSFSFTPEWWWSGWAHPLVFWLVGAAAMGLYSICLAWMIRNPVTSGRYSRLARLPEYRAPAGRR